MPRENFHYKAYGLSITSDIELKGIELNKNYLNNENSDVKIHLKKFSNLKTETIANGRYKWREKNIINIYDKNLGFFNVNDGKEIIVAPSDKLSKNELIHYISGLLFAVILFQRGYLVLHGSSLNINGNAVCFIGPPKIGKSTVAMLTHQQGHAVISDDILALKITENGAIIYPGFPYLRISEDLSKFLNLSPHNYPINQKTVKNLYLAHKSFSHEPLPLKRIYVIKKNGNPKIGSIGPQDALMELIKNSYCILGLNNSEKAVNLMQCRTLLEHTIVKQLTVKHSLETIPPITELLEEDLFKP